VLPHTSLLGQNSISQAGKGSGQSRQRFQQARSCVVNLNLSSPIRKLAQRSGQMERNRHYLLPLLLLFDDALAAFFTEGFALAGRTGFDARTVRGSPKLAALTQRTAGNPSRIFFQVLPSSFEP